MAIENLSEKVARYAAEKTNEFMTSLVAQAFEDGYRMGYQDREDEIPVDLRDDKTEYVDLGLPSGTLWARDYEKKDGEVVYLSYCKASKLSIPTKEQINELLSCCKWEYETADTPHTCLKIVKCAGPNGQILYFNCTGKITTDKINQSDQIYFWNIDETEGSTKETMNMWIQGGLNKELYQIFSGEKIPVRLVKSK